MFLFFGFEDNLYEDFELNKEAISEQNTIYLYIIK